MAPASGNTGLTFDFGRMGSFSGAGGTAGAIGAASTIGALASTPPSTGLRSAAFAAASADPAEGGAARVRAAAPCVSAAGFGGGETGAARSVLVPSSPGELAERGSVGGGGATVPGGGAGEAVQAMSQPDASPSTTASAVRIRAMPLAVRALCQGLGTRAALRPALSPVSPVRGDGSLCAEVECTKARSP